MVAPIKKTTTDLVHLQLMCQHSLKILVTVKTTPAIITHILSNLHIQNVFKFPGCFVSIYSFKFILKF